MYDFWEIWDARSVASFTLVGGIESCFVVLVLDLDMIIVRTGNEESCFLVRATIHYVA